MLCSELQRQLDKPQVWFYKYFPTRIKNVGEREINDRKVIFDFKDGKAFEQVAQRTAFAMNELCGLDCGNIVFFTCPCINKYEKRNPLQGILRTSMRTNGCNQRL